MSDEIVFYHNPMSRARMVHWMLEEVGAPYRIEYIDLQHGEHKQPAFLAVNPMGKLPAIVHRGTAVTETGAICAYLADAFPAAGLSPRWDEPVRGNLPALDVLRRRLCRCRPHRPHARAPGAGTDLGPGLRALPGCDRYPGKSDHARALHPAAALQRRRCLPRLADRLRLDDQEPRAAAIISEPTSQRLSQRPAYKRFEQQGEQLLAQRTAAG